MATERELRRFDREQMARDRKLLEDAIAEVQRLRAVNAKLLEAMETALLLASAGKTAVGLGYERAVGKTLPKHIVEVAREAIEEAKK